MLTAYKNRTGSRRTGRFLRDIWLRPAAAIRSDVREAHLVNQNSTHSFHVGARPHLRALDEFHIIGLQTNLGQLRACPLASGLYGRANARTSFFSSNPDLVSNGLRPPLRERSRSSNSKRHLFRGAKLRLSEWGASALVGLVRTERREASQARRRATSSEVSSKRRDSRSRRDA